MTAVDSRLSTFTSTSGDNLALQEWPLPDGVLPRGVVLIVHGLGEHAGRYDALGQFLVQRGFAVRAYDHFGHGQSSGRHGTLSSDTRLLDDLDVLRYVDGRAVPPAFIPIDGADQVRLTTAEVRHRDGRSWHATVAARDLERARMESCGKDPVPGTAWTCLSVATAPNWM